MKELNSINSLKVSLDENQGKDSENITINPDFSDLINPNKQEHLISVDDIKKEAERLNSEAEKSDPKTILQSVCINPKDEILKPPTAIEYVSKINEPTPLGTLGNISTIIGKAKSRKSFFINIVVSAVLSEDLFLNHFRGALKTGNHKILYFDTEQGKYHVQLALKRICKQIGNPEPKNLKVYGLRKFNPSERLELIRYAIENTPNLGIVIIDGIKDLITSINDEDQSTMIVSELMKWSEEKNIHIMVVLHQNKNDNNARGHIGTELVNKSETVLSVTKSTEDKDISIVEAQYCRGIEPDPFAFEINSEGLPIIAENYEFRTASKKSKFDVNDLNDISKFEILNTVFSKGKSFTYNNLVTQLRLAIKKKFDKEIGENKVKDFITECKNNNWLLQEGDRKPYTKGEFHKNIEDE